MAYDLQLTDRSENTVEVAATDKESLSVIRDEVRLHGCHVSPIERGGHGFHFEATCDLPGKAREFLMGLSDVEVNG